MNKINYSYITSYEMQTQLISGVGGPKDEERLESGKTLNEARKSSKNGEQVEYCAEKQLNWSLIACKIWKIKSHDVAIFLAVDNEILLLY